MGKIADPLIRLLILTLLLFGAAGCDKAKLPTASDSLPPWMAALHKSAQAGDAEAQYLLGSAYLGWQPANQGGQKRRVRWDRTQPGGFVDPDAPPVDELKAVHWLERAAAQGDVSAQRELGLLYLPTNPFDQFDPDAYLAQKAVGESEVPPLPKGSVLDVQPVGVKRDAKTAMAWFAKAAANGDAESQYRLGIAYDNGTGVDKSLQEAFAWYGKAAEQGHGKAQVNLGISYHNGAGVARDDQRAFEWIRRAAEQGVPKAQHILGDMYSSGIGVQKDDVAAIEWIRSAAENGDIEAQTDVGYRYYAGIGAQQDLQKAASWWRKAADQGDLTAQTNLGMQYRDGGGVPKDASKALELFSKAAVSGYAAAQRELGVLFWTGQGTSADNVLAYAWTNLAAAAGDELATKSRFAFEGFMTPADLAEAQRLSSAWKAGTLIARSGTTTGRGPRDSTGASITKSGTGTAFIVSGDGHAITNQHVVNGCKELRLQGSDTPVKLLTGDVVNDLALLKLTVSDGTPAPLSADPAKTRQGEDIVVFGYPLNSVLSSGGNLTPGVVSALTGLGNNTNQIQITAPVQPGSSGSPVLNKKGEVVGVVSQKLSDAVLAKATGSVGQNVNFAVNGQTLRSFLDASQVKYKSGAGFFAGDKSTVELADTARQWTRVVECWK